MDDKFVDPNDMYQDGNENPSGNFSTSNELPKDGLHRSVGWTAIILLIVGVSLFYSGESWFSSATDNSPMQSAVTSAEPPSNTSGTANSSGAEIVSNKLQELTGLNISNPIKRDWAKEEEIAANRATVASFKSQLESISKLANSNTEELIQLQSKAEELRTSQAGAKIASDIKYVEQYIALNEKISELKVTIPVADGFATDMLALLKRVEQANDTSYLPQPFVLSRADDFVKQHRKKSVEIKRFSDALNSLIAETDQLTAGSPLESVLQSQKKVSADSLAESLVQARREAEEKAQQQLIKAEQALVQSEADLETGRIEAQTKLNYAAKKDLITNAAKQKLEREFNTDLSSIKTNLLPFISEGRNMRGNAQGKGPVSFSAIRNKGALENTADGLSKLSQAARNGRPLGEFPVNIQPFMITNNSVPGNVYNTAKYRAIEQYLEKAQSLLKKYGPLMVKKGMLAE